MKLPRLLLILVVLFGIFAVVFLVGYIAAPFLHFDFDPIAKALSGFAAFATLIAFILYVYYTYLLAVATAPGASLDLVQPDPINQPSIIWAVLTNRSKVSLTAWCNLHATVNNQQVSLGGFYGAKTAFPLQPYGNPHGWFTIDQLLEEVHTTMGEMEKGATDENHRRQLRLDVEFWYTTVNSPERIENARMRYYFDFRHKQLVLDF